MIMVAEDEHDRPSTQRSGAGAEYRFGGVQMCAHRSMTQLEDITEQNQSVDRLQASDQGTQRRLVSAQDIASQSVTQMEIREHERGHGRLTVVFIFPTSSLRLRRFFLYDHT
jgi:hypothetical protein